MFEYKPREDSAADIMLGTLTILAMEAFQGPVALVVSVYGVYVVSVNVLRFLIGK